METHHFIGHYITLLVITSPLVRNLATTTLYAMKNTKMNGLRAFRLATAMTISLSNQGI